MKTEVIKRAKGCRALAHEWRELASDQIVDSRQAILAIAGQYDRLAACFERAGRVFGSG